jgi:hypothetical protein
MGNWVLVYQKKFQVIAEGAVLVRRVSSWYRYKGSKPRPTPRFRVIRSNKLSDPTTVGWVAARSLCYQIRMSRCKKQGKES